MGTQKVETGALSDDHLDAVSGGDLKDQARQDRLDAVKQALEDKKAAATIKAFQNLIQD
jgi:hypothetical protein